MTNAPETAFSSARASVLKNPAANNLWVGAPFARNRTSHPDCRQHRNREGDPRCHPDAVALPGICLCHRPKGRKCRRHRELSPRHSRPDCSHFETRGTNTRPFLPSAVFPQQAITRSTFSTEPTPTRYPSRRRWRIRYAGFPLMLKTLIGRAKPPISCQRFSSGWPISRMNKKTLGPRPGYCHHPADSVHQSIPGPDDRQSSLQGSHPKKPPGLLSTCPTKPPHNTAASSATSRMP